MRKQLSQNLKQHLKEGKVDLDKLDRRIYLSLPSNESHVGHPVGEVSEEFDAVLRRFTAVLLRYYFGITSVLR